MISIVIFSKGHNSVKNVGGIMVLVLCTLFDNASYLYQDLCKYLKGLRSNYYADRISIVKFDKGHNTIKNVGGVMVLILCMSFNDALYLY